MKRIRYKVKLAFEIIVRGNKFLEAHPGIEIEDYLRAQVVLYSTRSLNYSDSDLEREKIFEKEMLFSFNLSLEKSLKKNLEEHCISMDHYIRDACTQIDKDLILGNVDTIRGLNLILRAI